MSVCFDEHEALNLSMVPAHSCFFFPLPPPFPLSSLSLSRSSPGAVVVGIAGYLMFKTSLFMSSLTFKHVTYFGFYLGGITTTLVVLGLAVLYRRYCGLHPEALYKDVLRRVSQTPVVVEKFGELFSSQWGSRRW